jgi:hypothetical protein
MDDLSRVGPAVLKYFKDKYVEINTGESATSFQFIDHEVGQKDVIRGYLREVVGDAIIIECKVGAVTQPVLINAWAVICIIELIGHGNVSDIYVDEYKERNNMRKLKK